MCCEYLPIDPRFSLWWYPVCYSRAMFTYVLPSEITLACTLSSSYLCTSVAISNTYNRTHVLLNHYFINTIHKPNIFQPLKNYLQGVQFIHSSSAVLQNELSVAKFNLVCSVNCVTRQYMLELCIVLIKW